METSSLMSVLSLHSRNSRHGSLSLTPSHTHHTHSPQDFRTVMDHIIRLEAISNKLRNQHPLLMAQHHTRSKASRSLCRPSKTIIYTATKIPSSLSEKRKLMIVCKMSKDGRGKQISNNIQAGQKKKRSSPKNKFIDRRLKAKAELMDASRRPPLRLEADEDRLCPWSGECGNA